MGSLPIFPLFFWQIPGLAATLVLPKSKKALGMPKISQTFFMEFSTNKCIAFKKK
jgi:hypothetical protein